MDIHHIFSSYFESEPDVKDIAYLLSQKLENGSICVYPEELPKRDPVFSGQFVGKDIEVAKPIILYKQLWYLQKYFQYENTLLNCLNRFFSESALHYENRSSQLTSLHALIHRLIEQNSPDETDWQMLGALNAYLENFSILTGGPGTGKTTSIRLFLYLLFKTDPQSRVALLAPTGKAAARMNDSLQGKSHLTFPDESSFSAFTDKAESSTIHRAIGFGRRKSQLVPYDVVIVDEASMIDISLLVRLLQAIPPHSRIVLIGDQNQLPSVEAGSVFGDLCRSSQFEKKMWPAWKKNIFDTFSNFTQAPNNSLGNNLSDKVIHLKKSHRFKKDSAIGKASRDILNGTFHPESYSADTIQCNLEINSPEFKALVDQFLSFLNEPDIQKALDELNNTRILCALRIGKEGSHAINQMIEQRFEEKGLLKPADGFYHNQPILITSNHHDLKLYNGDQGLVRRQNGSLRAFFSNGSEINDFPVARINQYETAFAGTIHKSQGSEYKHVGIVLPEKSDHDLLSRELLYTAITRARETVHIFGKLDVISNALSKKAEPATGIEHRLKLG